MCDMLYHSRSVDACVLCALNHGTRKLHPLRRSKGHKPLSADGHCNKLPQIAVNLCEEKIAFLPEQVANPIPRRKKKAHQKDWVGSGLVEKDVREIKNQAWKDITETASHGVLLFNPSAMWGMCGVVLTAMYFPQPFFQWVHSLPSSLLPLPGHYCSVTYGGSYGRVGGWRGSQWGGTYLDYIANSI